MFFFGEVEANMATKDLHKQSNYVDQVATFGGSDPAHCTNCKRQEKTKILSRAQVLLTPALLNVALDEHHPLHYGDNIQLGHNPDETPGANGVWNFLKSKLYYKVVDVRFAPLPFFPIV